MKPRIKYYLLMPVISMLAACSVLTGKSQAVTLYEEMGGKPAFEKITNAFVVEIGKRESLMKHFSAVGVDGFKERIEDHFCLIADGPCEGPSDSMETIHAGMNITERDFNHLADALYDAMEASGIPYTQSNLFVARLVPMRDSIMYK